MPTQKTGDWREKLMDEFCVMFERAQVKTDIINEPVDWVDRMESFIESLLEEQREEIRGAIENQFVQNRDFDREKDAWNRGLDTVLELPCLQNKEK